MSIASPRNGGPMASSRAPFAIVKSDSNPVAKHRGLYIGTGGDLHIKPADDATATTVIFKNVANGQVLDIVVSRVLAASTCSDIVGFN